MSAVERDKLSHEEHLRSILAKLNIDNVRGRWHQKSFSNPSDFFLVLWVILLLSVHTHQFNTTTPRPAWRTHVTTTMASSTVNWHSIITAFRFLITHELIFSECYGRDKKENHIGGIYLFIYCYKLSALCLKKKLIITLNLNPFCPVKQRCIRGQQGHLKGLY